MRARRSDDQDLGFGGWRDWLTVVVFLPVFLGALYAGAMVAIGSRGGPFLLSPKGGLAVTVVALVVGVASARARRVVDDEHPL